MSSPEKNVFGKKAAHFETCIDPNCERKWCVDRRNAECLKNDYCEVPRGSTTSGRCIWCHTQYFCSGYGECELHGDHGP